MRKSESIRMMVLAAMFLAIAYVLPFLTGQIPEIGAMLCLMHIPVLLCGFVCGGPWGILVGFMAPLLRSVTLGMPPLFPTAFCMAFELATYGGVAGFLYRVLHGKKKMIYVTLLIAMISGRIVWGIMMAVCLGVQGGTFGIEAFLAGAITNAIPGIVVQFLLIPVLVMTLDKTKVVQFDYKVEQG